MQSYSRWPECTSHTEKVASYVRVWAELQTLRQIHSVHIQSEAEQKAPALNRHAHIRIVDCTHPVSLSDTKAL